MRRLIVAWTCFLCAAASALEVEITFNNDAVRTVGRVQVQAGRLMLPAENLAVPLDQVRDAQIVSTNFSAAAVTRLLEQGAFEELLGVLDGVLQQAGDVISLPGSIDCVLYAQLTALVFTGRYDEAAHAADILSGKSSSYARQAALFRILIQIEQGQTDAAAQALDSLSGSVAQPGAFIEYLRGRLAFLQKEYEPALQHFSNILVHYGRDPVWAPAAELAEGRVYKRTGYLEAAAHVADTLSAAYSGVFWSRQAGELR